MTIYQPQLNSSIDPLFLQLLLLTLSSTILLILSYFMKCNGRSQFSHSEYIIKKKRIREREKERKIVFI